jgi:hypothetical protein
VLEPVGAGTTAVVKKLLTRYNYRYQEVKPIFKEELRILNSLVCINSRRRELKRYKSIYYFSIRKKMVQ